MHNIFLQGKILFLQRRCLLKFQELEIGVKKMNNKTVKNNLIKRENVPPTHNSHLNNTVAMVI